jgi:hypothetical protein
MVPCEHFNEPLVPQNMKNCLSSLAAVLFSTLYCMKLVSHNFVCIKCIRSLVTRNSSIDILD